MYSENSFTAALSRGVVAAWWSLAAALLLSACTRRATVVSSGYDLPQDQWSRGVWMYGQHCAGCHGENGEGSEDGPALVGAEALPESGSEEGERALPFRNWADVFAYSSDKMPALDPGSVEPDAMWSILAYIAKERGTELDGDLGPESAAATLLR